MLTIYVMWRNKRERERARERERERERASERAIIIPTLDESDLSILSLEFDLSVLMVHPNNIRVLCPTNGQRVINVVYTNMLQISEG